MKKLMALSVLGLLLVGGNLYAANGDLIVENGNIGVGTSAPQRKIDITGLSFEGLSASPDAGAIRFGDNSGWKLHIGRSRESVGGALNSGALGSLMTIQDDGRVGVGTTNPTNRLQVIGDASSLGIASTRYNTTGGGLLFLQHARGTLSAPTTVLTGDETGKLLYSGFDGASFINSAGIVGIVDGVVAAGTVPTGLSFQTGSPTRAEQMRITSNGNVGIGTTGPGAKLTIAGGGTPNSPDGTLKIGDKGIMFGGPNNGYEVNSAQISAGQHAANSLNIVGMGTTGSNRKIDIWNEGGLTTRGPVYMTGGNVGIGTTSPWARLSVDSRGSALTAISGEGGQAGVYGSTDSWNGKGVYGYAGGSSAYGVYCYSSTNAYGCGGNRAWNYPSDETLKENISTVSDALSKIKQLRGVNYNWKADPEKKRQIGMIAQEVKAVIPEAIGKDPDGNLTMSDGPVVALLTEAIKEQQKQIEALKAEIEALKSAK